MNKFIPMILFMCCHAIVGHAASYAVARGATPVLNSSAFRSVFGGADGKTGKTDRCGQMRELEFIALPGTVFSIRAKKSDGENTIFQVDTDDYPMPVDSLLYVDSRFVDLRERTPPPRIRVLPSQPSVIAALKASTGVPYVWGGNIQGGIDELIGLFYYDEVPTVAGRPLTLAGLDCSGLLYQATGGWTPRNTSQLLSFGKAVHIAGKSLEKIVESLEPLDLIVWNGHVIIVLDRDTTIESRLECGKKGNGGVMIKPLRQRLAEILRTRRPLDSWPAAGKRRDGFVARRWIST